MGEAVTVYISLFRTPLVRYFRNMSNKFHCKMCVSGKLYLCCYFISEVLLFSLMRFLIMVNGKKKTLYPNTI